MSRLVRLHLLAAFPVLLAVVVLSWPALTSGDDGPRKQAEDDPEPRSKQVPGPELRESGGREARGAVLTVKIIRDDDTFDDKPAPLTVNGKLTNLTGGTRTFYSPPLRQGQKYSYTFVATLKPNNYETYTRTRTVLVTARDSVTIDMTKRDPKIPDGIVIRYVPTPKEFVEAMMKLAKVGKDDVVYDLGSGDGRIVIAAVEKHGAKAGVGIEIDAKLVKQAKGNAREAKVGDKVEFRDGDVMKVKDLEKATVICMYMSDGLNGQMWPILQKHCKPGTRIVTHRFLMGNRGEETGPKPEKSVEVFSNELGFDYTEKVHLWTIGGAKKDKDRKKEKEKEREKLTGKEKIEAEKALEVAKAAILKAKEAIAQAEADLKLAEDAHRAETDAEKKVEKARAVKIARDARTVAELRYREAEKALQDARKKLQ